MLQICYTLAFIAAIFYLLFLFKYKNKISVFYLLLYMAILLTDFGYMQMSAATTLEAAVFANQTVYLGACFSPFFFLMCIGDLCKFQVRKVYQIAFAALATIIFVMISTIGIFPLYYKNVRLESIHGVNLLVKEYGPFHILYPAYLAIICGVGLYMIINAMRRRKEVSYITSLLLMGCLLAVITTYFVEKIMHFGIELLPFVYVITEAACLFLLRRISQYEIAAISSQSMLESYTHGFILFSSNGKYLGSDESAKIWFPEINELSIDRKIKTEGTELFDQIGKWLRKEAESDVHYIEKSDKLILEVSHSVLRDNGSKSIHCLYLEDETEQMQYTKLVKQYNENLERDVDLKTKKLRKVQNDIILSMASIVENRDSNTGGHIARTSDIVKIFIEHLLCNKQFGDILTQNVANSIIKAAPLHDFGKIGIPDSVLNKPGKFTDEEYEIMKQHSAKGAVIVEQILRHSENEEFKKIAINVAHYHHEKWDGKGYPEGISGTDIPFEARVMALADVFDALVSKRVYKDSFSYDKAFSIIEESKGSHFDPVLCEAFLECRQNLEDLYNSYTD